MDRRSVGPRGVWQARVVKAKGSGRAAGQGCSPGAFAPRLSAQAERSSGAIRSRKRRGRARWVAQRAARPVDQPGHRTGANRAPAPRRTCRAAPSPLARLRAEPPLRRPALSDPRRRESPGRRLPSPRQHHITAVGRRLDLGAWGAPPALTLVSAAVEGNGCTSDAYGCWPAGGEYTARTPVAIAGTRLGAPDLVTYGAPARSMAEPARQYDTSGCGPRDGRARVPLRYRRLRPARCQSSSAVAIPAVAV